MVQSTLSRLEESRFGARKAIYPRYQRATRVEKQQVLDEGYPRMSALRFLNPPRPWAAGAVPPPLPPGPDLVAFPCRHHTARKLPGCAAVRLSPSTSLGTASPSNRSRQCRLPGLDSSTGEFQSIHRILFGTEFRNEYGVPGIGGHRESHVGREDTSPFRQQRPATPSTTSRNTRIPSTTSRNTRKTGLPKMQSRPSG
jgi:hypothetical protein